MNCHTDRLHRKRAMQKIFWSRSLLSSTHIGYSSIRMEPVYMLLGHSAGVAAVMALREELPVQDISWKNLQRELRRQKQRIKGFVTN